MTFAEFVTFHVSLAQGEGVHPNKTLAHLEYISNIDMMLESAKIHHPDMTAAILTNETTSLEGVSVPFFRFNSEVKAASLMLDRTKAQMGYIEASSFIAPIIILDSDILVNAKLDAVLEKDFDVALTWRDNDEMPLNGGFMILNNRRPELSKQFFRQFAELYIERYSGQADWYGDQLALRDIIGLTPAEMSAREIVNVGGCRILLLPCEVYNFSPENKYQAISAGLAGKVIVHFKGKRKRLMPLFFQARVKPGAMHALWARLKLAVLACREKRSEYLQRRRC